MIALKNNNSELLNECINLIKCLRNSINVDVNWPKFRLLVESNQEEIIKTFDVKWLISICDTYADFGNALESRNAMFLSLFVGMNRLSDTYFRVHKSCIEQDNLNLFKERRVPLYSGLKTMHLDRQDTCLNISKRLVRFLSETPMFLAFYQEIITRFKQNGSLIQNFSNLSIRPEYVFPIEPLALPDNHGVV